VSIIVVGSLNMDLVVSVKKRPRTGETVLGSDVLFVGGGKGANQAIAAARLGGQVAMVGKVGDDPFGKALCSNLANDGVDTSGIQVETGVSSGVAFITVDDAGGNQIIVSPGANGRLLPDDIKANADLIGRSKVLLLQLEIPIPTVIAAAELAHQMGVTVILDPAPAQPLPEKLLKLVDFFTPNEHEAASLSGQPISDLRSAKLAAAKLMSLGCHNVILKLGEKGVLLAEGNHFQHIPAFPVPAVDTTAAGDAFGAAFAVSWLESRDVYQALRFAAAAGAITVTREGAQSSLPYRREVEELLLS
jgi:ribokinase